jgi:SAM-dependent methyltransferase
MKDETQVASYFSRDAQRFDAIYDAGAQRSPLQRLVDAAFRRRELQRRIALCARALAGARSVLEVGCGSGRVAVALLDAGVERVTGIDLSEDMVALSRRLAERLGVADRCEFVCAAAEGFAPAQRFDAVVALGVTDYVDDPRPLLARIGQLAAQRVIVSFPRRGMWLNPARRLWLRRKRCPVYFYSRREIEDLFRGLGVSAPELVPFGSPPLTGSYLAVARLGA